jgi:hypothetical protein
MNSARRAIIERAPTEYASDEEVFTLASLLSRDIEIIYFEKSWTKKPLRGSGLPKIFD